MRKLLGTYVVVVALAMTLGTGVAMAQIDAELAFSPAVASPGDPVALFASVANLGDEPVVADVEVTITVGVWTFGPIPGVLPLAAGEERSVELAFIVPPVPMGGELTLTLTASAGEFSDTASATLAIVTTADASDEEGLRNLGKDLVSALTGKGEDRLADATLSEFKNLYR
ncbi:MAG: hypothetical protein ACE5G2_05285 [Candidatus Krumholzibacteriia bacterium]